MPRNTMTRNRPTPPTAVADGRFSASVNSAGHQLSWATATASGVGGVLAEDGSSVVENSVTVDCGKGFGFAV